MNAREAVEQSKWFGLSEWPDPSVLDGLRPKVITDLDRLRERYGKPIHPSKHPRGWVRRDGSPASQHFFNGSIKSTAADVFPEGRVTDCWLIALDGPWTGVGLYLDTRIIPGQQPGPMLHLDQRIGHRVLWVRDEGQYVYHHREPKRFWELFGRCHGEP